MLGILNLAVKSTVITLKDFQYARHEKNRYKKTFYLSASFFFILLVWPKACNCWRLIDLVLLFFAATRLFPFNMYFFSLLQKKNYVISKICEVPTDKLERLVQVASILRKATMGEALVWHNTTV